MDRVAIKLVYKILCIPLITANAYDDIHIALTRMGRWFHETSPHDAFRVDVNSITPDNYDDHNIY